MQLFFRLIYNLKSVELKTSKTYIKVKLVNCFIWFFKFTIKAHIFLNNKQKICSYFVWIIRVLTILLLKINIFLLLISELLD